ncbi:MAG: methyltransferase domain-containing protein [Oscillospiraceae bacterium]|nr:methyltransferase domain-containing protein [Oscillospiraceae bacterium]
MMNYECLRCPVCGQALTEGARALRCGAGHCFDLAKEGYVNLLIGSKPADAMGDNKQAARYRRDFLNKGYYAPLRDALTARFAGRSGTLLDLCCGEGYYTAALGQNPALTVYGFDLAREMVRLAAKRNAGLQLFVANLARIPVRDGVFDWATLLFAPFGEAELCRVLRPGGRLTLVVPGRRHLFGLKQAVYESPYENDEALPAAARLQLLGTEKVIGRIILQGQDDIQAVFRMTPYYYRTSPSDRAKLERLDALETEIEFVLAEFENP